MALFSTPRPLLVLALTGCDYTFVTHLRVDVSAEGKPLAGAWVLGCGQAGQTDASGTAKLERGEFLGGPCQSPVVVTAPGFRPSATFMENAGTRAEVHDAGGCATPSEVEESWSVRATLRPVSADSGVQATCELGRTCTILVPDLTSGAAAVALLVERGGDEAPRIVALVPGSNTPAGTGGLTVSFTIPKDIPTGSQVTPMVSWYRRTQTAVTGPDGTTHEVEGYRPRDGVALFADPVIVGE